MNAQQTSHPVAVRTLSMLLQEAGSVDGALAKAIGDMKRQPTDVEIRWSLFEWLAVTEQWERALGQLDILCAMKPSLEPAIHMWRSLLDAECARQRVFNGQARPSFPCREALSWQGRLVDAIGHNAAGHVAAADHVRTQAMGMATSKPGCCERGAFTWMSDTDSRLGPTLEVFQEGRYLWVPFSAIDRIRIAPVKRLMDRVWLETNISLSVGTTLTGHVPARYPGSSSHSDAVVLGNQTHWNDTGESCVAGAGQRTWMTDLGDLSIFDIREIVFRHAD
ncbi:MAG: type VI secretion system accessory protein TagJ [Rhodocyclaceae bacterium]